MVKSASITFFLTTLNLYKTFYSFKFYYFLGIALRVFSINKKTMVKTLIFDYFPSLMASTVIVLFINIVTVNGLFLQKRLFSGSSDHNELLKCSICKNYFNNVIKKLPDDIEKNSGLQIFKNVLKVKVFSFVSSNLFTQ